MVTGPGPGIVRVSSDRTMTRATSPQTSRFRGLIEDEDGNDFDVLYTHYIKKIYTPVMFISRERCWVNILL